MKMKKFEQSSKVHFNAIVNMEQTSFNIDCPFAITEESLKMIEEAVVEKNKDVESCVIVSWCRFEEEVDENE